MNDLIAFYSFIILCIAAYLFLRLRSRYRYNKAMAEPFPEDWQELLTKRLGIYKKLPEELQNKLKILIKDFLYKKRFVGCDGFVITDEVRVIIAAEACLLILNRPSTRYKDLKWVYIYPSTFESKYDHTDRHGVVTEGRQSLLGVSWSNGRVVLAWDNVEHGFKHLNDGHNVVFHEFAHQLDQEDGSADGAPLLHTRDSYRIWSSSFSKEFENLQSRLAKGKPTVIDAYGATNPAEFFAVVTELYFERPDFLKKYHYDLYTVLKDYYAIETIDYCKD